MFALVQRAYRRPAWGADRRSEQRRSWRLSPAAIVLRCLQPCGARSTSAAFLRPADVRCELSEMSAKHPLESLDYPTAELVFGIVAAVGTDLDQFQNGLVALLKHYNYEGTPVRLSGFLRAASAK